MMNNYFVGGTGGSGGPGYGNGLGGSGGDGMGASLNCDIQVRDGNFIMNNAIQQDERGIYILHGAVAAAAVHDSAESYPQPRCHPETRAKMLKYLHHWALDKNIQHNILWLYGPAGAGKSAIMQILARQIVDSGRLGGSFFFKRDHPTRGNGRMLFATIAYQLALHAPWLRAQISEIVERDPSIVRRDIETQMQRLISEPCRSHPNRDRLTILIDSLDECEGPGHGIQEEILRVIRIGGSQFTIPLRFIVASRPEPHIREMFDSAFYSVSVSLTQCGAIIC
ncbi:putative nwd2 protein [Mycena sanguinolenta]|uniref:Putative nwd2 protein n=1 Tax=Mycena sanguinolenta TaxID=230812 RepID=A0A8H6Z8Z6_9AGAR|nr:putative nwd2 protein [Mycena sanguinolenta]